MDKTDIIIVGVGGQGTLLASKILGEAALRAGLGVMASEVHGMAQRGGVVNSTVRIGDVHSPLAADSDAEVILAFEPVEAVRALNKANPGKTTIITNTSSIIPFTVSIKMDEYPPMEEVMSQLEKGAKKLIKVEMEQMARDNGIPVIAANIIMLGILVGTGTVPVPREVMLETIADNVPKKFLDENRKAFEVGFAFGEDQK